MLQAEPLTADSVGHEATSSCPTLLAEQLAEHLDAALIQDPVFFYDLELFRDAELAKFSRCDAGAYGGPDASERGQDFLGPLVHVDLDEVEVVESGAF